MVFKRFRVGRKSNRGIKNPQGERSPFNLKIKIMTVTQLKNDSFQIEKNDSIYITEIFQGEELTEMEMNTKNDWVNYLRNSQSYKAIK